MAKLKVFLEGKLVSEHTLSPGQEFVAGRGESCDLVLKPEKGISRQHFKLRMTEVGWEIESLSRFGELYVDGQKVERSVLQHGVLFAVPPYEFVFDDQAVRVASDVTLPSITQKSKTGATGSGVTGTGDKTKVIGNSNLAAVLRLIDGQGQPLQTYSLQGLSWVAGRDVGSPIFIDDNRVSRNQFELQRVEDTFYIRDLGSQNGTTVNSLPIAQDQWTTLSSGDTIGIADLFLIFEIRDIQFEQRLHDVDPALRNPPMVAVPAPEPGAYNPVAFEAMPEPPPMPAMSIPMGGTQGPPGMKVFGKHVPGLNPVRLMIGVIILVGAGYWMMDSGGESEQASRAIKPQTPFDTLPPEKQQLVRQAYQLARDLYTTGKYELANQKIMEIHNIIPYYEDSKELQQYIDNAIEIQRNRDQLLAQAEEEKKRQEKVQAAIIECRKLLDKKDTVVPEDMDRCLAPVVEFDPENQEFVALKAAVDQIVLDRNVEKAKQEEYQRLVALRQKMFDRAVGIEKRGRSLAAISAYRTVVQSPLPDPKLLKRKAQRRIAALQSSIGKRQADLISQAEEAYKAGDRKRSIELLRRALRINPNNYDIEDRITAIIAELRKEMQVKYQEAILEESIGSVAEAKKRWFEIIQSSIPGEEYFQKSQVKLRKYGEEL